MAAMLLLLLLLVLTLPLLRGDDEC